MNRKLIAVIFSILLLIPGWLGGSGLTLLCALVPMLWISSQVEDSRRGWWQMFGWSALIGAGWNLSTVMWIWHATPVGPFAATVASTACMLLGVMVYHSVSKRATKALSYTVLISMWIAIEHIYTYNDFSWPWLLLGNGLSNDIWAVQWYEYTGLYGGSLWILLSNILIFEAWQRRTRAMIISAVGVVAVPLVISVAIYFTYAEPELESVEVSVIQPNVDCYDKFNGSAEAQRRNLMELLCELPSTVDFIFMPETSIPGYCWEEVLDNMLFVKELRDTLDSRFDDAMLISGVSTIVSYKDGEHSQTSRTTRDGVRYDQFNSAIGLTRDEGHQLHHKAKLVIGVENTPTFIFDIFNFFVIDLGGVVGQLGKGDSATTFSHSGVTTAPAICYEGLYGDFFADFVAGGAQFMGIISNDGWWGDTAGHRHLYTMSALRAVETRRTIARSANTGISGFISPRGDNLESLGWEQRGTITRTVWLSNEMTIYTLYGDYIGYLARFIAVLSLLYYLAFRVKQRNYLD